MASPSHLPPRPRALAELSLDPVVARAADLAQRWAIALIGARPLEDIGGLPLEDIAREGPAICAQLLRALQSDIELDRLTAEGSPSGRESSALALRLGAIAGAEEAGGLIVAVEALRGVLWGALIDDLGRALSERSAARQLADLSDRLAHVCARALSAAVGALETGGERPGSESQPASAAESSARDRGEAGASHHRAVIVDEHDPGGSPAGRVEPTVRRVDAPRAGDRTEPTGAPIRPAAAAPVRPAAAAPERPLSWDESPPVPPGARASEIEIRDERRDEGPAAWIRSIGGQLERYGQDGAPFVVLLVEPVEIDRLLHATPPDELEDVVGRLAEALAAIHPGTLTVQRPGRYWLLAPATSLHEGRVLAERLQRELGAAVQHQGAPLQLAVGVAGCPEDGLEAAALAAHADVGLYANRSAIRRAGERNPVAGAPWPSAG